MSPARQSLSVFCSLLFLTLSALAQNVRPASAEDLTLRVIPEKMMLTSSDSLLMKVEVTNVGKDVVLFNTDDLCLNPGSGLTMTITDAKGKPVKSSVPLSCTPVPNHSEIDAFVHLEPDAFFGRFVRIAANRISHTPGRYTLKFTLRGTLSNARFAQIFATGKRSVVAFTSESSTLTFDFPIQINR